MNYANSEGYPDPTAGAAIVEAVKAERAEKKERLRGISWEDYGIDRERYQELKHFCLQYRRKKKLSVSLVTSSAPAITYDKVGSGGFSSGSPTEREAIAHADKAEKAKHDCRLIEEAAMWAAGAGGYRKAWQAIVDTVADGLTYEQASGRHGLPFCAKDFYGLRRAFFHRLDVLQTQEENARFRKVDQNGK